MVGIVGLQVITPMMGLAMVVATLRGLFGGREAMAQHAAAPARHGFREARRDAGDAVLS